MTRSYFEALTRLRTMTWESVAERWDELALPERLVLVHPDWIGDAGLSEEIEAIQGERAFIADVPGRLACESRLIWGYDCTTRDRLQRDHLWPYALGGPTKPGNFIFLCRQHNSLKGVDVHCYPWDHAESKLLLWLDEQIALMRKLLLHA
jgi:hypothetical protein